VLVASLGGFVQDLDMVFAAPKSFIYVIYSTKTCVVKKLDFGVPWLQGTVIDPG
jgi:hypothetical protein